MKLSLLRYIGRAIFVASTTLTLSSCVTSHDGHRSVMFPNAVTKAEALSLPARDLAKRVLGPLSVMIEEVERPTFSGMLENSVLSDLFFAGRPEASGNPGLCKAKVVSVSFAPVPEYSGPDSEQTPVEPFDVDAVVVFKVIGNTDRDTADDDHEYYNKLERDCRKAGRVLPTESSHASEQEHFFRVFDPTRFSASNDAWLGANVLQRFAQAARLNEGPKPTCTEDELRGFDRKVSICSDVVTFLASLDVRSLMSIKVAFCGEQKHLCVEAAFAVPRRFKPLNILSVKAEAELRDAATLRRDVASLVSINVNAGLAIIE